MYLLVADETNQRPSKNAQFFVYGALFLPIASLIGLDEGIEEIRRKAGYRLEDQFKFNTRARPDNVSIEACTAAKSTVLNLCCAVNCKFIVHVILHEIIKNQDIEQQSYWAADYVFGRFNTFLREEANDYGVCIIDNLPTKNQYKYLTEKFTIGLTLHTGTTIRLSRIKMFGTSCLGASHINSAMDIVLGSFRYCINNPRNEDAARNMMGRVVDLLWHHREGDTIHFLNKGLSIRPNMNKIKVQEHKEKYEALFRHINESIKGA